MNVIGTMQLLAACQRSPVVRKLVVKSTAAVYGAGSRDPAMFTEDMVAASRLPSSGYAQDNAEIEAYVRGFGRRRPDVAITTLRFTNLIGPTVDTVLTRYFSLPGAVPMVLGRDARLQLLHSEDALAVLERAAVEDLPGVYNVAGDGVLMLTQALRRAGRVPMPVPRPALPPVTGAFSSAKLADLTPEQLRFLNVGRVVDTTRLREQFGFEPRWTSRQAFDDFIRGHDVRPVVDPELVTAAEQRLGGLLKKLPVAGERA
jgi:UDP-glucose 4-epimerase